jgi:transposase
MRYKVPTLSWPGIIPDLNPTENIWGLLKKHLGKSILINQTDMWKALQQPWYAIPNHLRKNQIYCIHKRIKVVIFAKGEAASY